MTQPLQSKKEWIVEDYARHLGIDYNTAKKKLEKAVRDGLMFKSKTYKWCDKGGWWNRGGNRQINCYCEY